MNDTKQHTIGTYSTNSDLLHITAKDRAKDLDLAEAIANYEPNGEYKYTDTNLQIWSLKSLASLLNDSWTPDTGVYDLVAHTASLSFFRERLDKEPNKQYLVPIDFHF